MNTIFFDFEPGDRVKNPKAPDWGIGQVQSIIKNKVTVIIAARMGSSRFKGKTMSDLYGKPLIYRLIERVKFSKNIISI